MSSKAFPGVEELPRRSATYARTKWPNLRRKVRSAGCVAITKHGKVQVIAMSAANYRNMAALVDEERKFRRGRRRRR
jgi:PHD/YefM family antitoxin component YafN of YafNO toxin-antitoxin module